MLDHKRSIVSMDQTQRQGRDVGECYEKRCIDDCPILASLWVGFRALKCHGEDDVSGYLLISLDTTQQSSR